MNLPNEEENVLGRDVSFANSVDPLERGVGLECGGLAKVLSGELNLDFDLSCVNHELGQFLLGDH